MRKHFYHPLPRHTSNTYYPLTLKMTYAPISFYDMSCILNNKILLKDVHVSNVNEIPTYLSSLVYQQEIFDEQLIEDPIASFDHLVETETTTFESFFALNLVDIPICFRKSKSLYRDLSFNMKSRLINNVARHGRKEYVRIIYSNALSTIIEKLASVNVPNTVNSRVTWKYTYLALALRSQNSNPILFNEFLLKNLVLENADSLVHSPEDYFLEDRSVIETSLTKTLVNFSPVFAFYVKQVDKLKRKHSRGKSGKYSISWKYVPEYKRMWVLIRWLAKDIKFQKARTLSLKILNSLDSLYFSQSTHLVYQLRQFVHRFVFQNYKKSLLKTLRSTS